MTLSEVDQLCSVLKGKEFSHIAYNRAKEQYITLYLKVRLSNGHQWKSLVSLHIPAPDALPSRILI